MTSGGLDRLRHLAVRAAAVGVVGCALGAVLDPGQLLRSYLVAYVFWTGCALGCLAILMINYVTGGVWGAAIRRLLEAGAGTLPLLALAFLPLAAGVGRLYVWARPDAVARDALLQHTHPFLNVPFFLGRTVFYFAAWIAVARALRRWSLGRDARPDPAAERRLELLSRGGLVLLGLTMTFAAVDWMMSLEPHWYSTIYGVIFMGGSVLTAFAFVIAVAALLSDDPDLARVLTPDAFHDLGKLLLAFLMLWAYFSYSQFLIIWAGNLPEEIPWYLARTRGGWGWLALGVVVFHFALPFPVLLSRTVKRRARTLAVVAAALLAVRFLDLFWQIAPAFHPGRLAVHWLDATTVLALGGFWLAAFVRGLAAGPLVPRHDPVLEGAA
ncbi:MAG TPA: hypothetical protein VKW76_04345 [Candidatus Binatia bacterium]|nr:hypothetical protein [Candidatus Binatia bacterium]